MGAVACTTMGMLCLCVVGCYTPLPCTPPHQLFPSSEVFKVVHDGYGPGGVNKRAAAHCTSLFHPSCPITSSSMMHAALGICYAAPLVVGSLMCHAPFMHRRLPVLDGLHDAQETVGGVLFVNSTCQLEQKRVMYMTARAKAQMMS